MLNHHRLVTMSHNSSCTYKKRLHCDLLRICCFVSVYHNIFDCKSPHTFFCVEKLSVDS